MIRVEFLDHGEEGEEGVCCDVRFLNYFLRRSTNAERLRPWLSVSASLSIAARLTLSVTPARRDGR
jgi:hypothetical protein